MQEPFWIYGAGGMGKETLWLIEDSMYNNVIGFIDDYKTLSKLHDKPVINRISNEVSCVIAIADSKSRKKISLNESLNFVNVLHPKLSFHKSNIIGVGNIISKGVVITVDIKIGNHVIINSNSTIGHDTIIEDYVSIMSGVHISGNVIIKEGTFIGAGAVVLQNIKIGKWCTIGAGAVVTKDINDGKTCLGIPAKEKI
jgi:acetyltransferase EpsM